MYKQTSPTKIWNTVCDANVELFRARMNFSAEMFDLYTKWPRRSFSDMTEALKAAHLETLKLLEEKAEKPAVKKASGSVAKAQAAPKKKARSVAPKKAKVQTKPKPAAVRPATKAGAKPVTLPEIPAFGVKPRAAETPAAPKPADTPEKDS